MIILKYMSKHILLEITGPVSQTREKSACVQAECTCREAYTRAFSRNFCKQQGEYKSVVEYTSLRRYWKSLAKRGKTTQLTIQTPIIADSHIIKHLHKTQSDIKVHQSGESSGCGDKHGCTDQQRASTESERLRQHRQSWWSYNKMWRWSRLVGAASRERQGRLAS